MLGCSCKARLFFHGFHYKPYKTTRKRGRITPVIRKLDEVWRKFPDLRLGQLLIDCAGDKDLFNLEDDELLEALERFGENNDFGQIL